MKLSKLNNLSLVTLLVLVVSGCATESATQKEFGSSVRHMITQQTYEPGDEVPELDGIKSRNVLDVYRTDVAKPKNVEKKVINIKFE